jgi:hypothetical protein
MSIHRRKFLTTLGIGLSSSVLGTPTSIDEKDELKTEFVFKAEVLVDKLMDLGATHTATGGLFPLRVARLKGR